MHMKTIIRQIRKLTLVYGGDVKSLGKSINTLKKKQRNSDINNNVSLQINGRKTKYQYMFMYIYQNAGQNHYNYSCWYNLKTTEKLKFLRILVKSSHTFIKKLGVDPIQGILLLISIFFIDPSPIFRPKD